MAAPLKWFPFYVDDWETDEKVDALTLEEQGAYQCLLRWQWREGAISSDPATVAAKLIVRSARAKQPLSHRMAIAKRLLREFFVDTGDNTGRVVNTKLAEIYAKQCGKSEKARRAAQLSHSSRTANAVRSQDDRTRSAAQSSRSRVVDIEKSLSASAGDKTATAGVR